jgi:hypothetical protein
MSAARRQRIIADIVLDGWAEAARRVYRKVRNMPGTRVAVWVDGAGCVWTRGVCANEDFTPPEHQFLATYRAGIPINEIEDDMLDRLRSMTNTRKAA